MPCNDHALVLPGPQTTDPQVQSDRNRLCQLLVKQSFRFGHFVLASGKTSDYYVDCRLTTLSGEGADLIGRLLYPTIAALGTDAVGGMTMGADPIVSALLCRSAAVGRPINGFLVRKASKGHGTGKLVEGHLAPWMRVVLVEDVVTTGGSVVQAVESIYKAAPGVTISGILAIVDRQAGGEATFRSMGIPYQALFQVSEILAANAASNSRPGS